MSMDRRAVLLSLGAAALTSCAAPGSAVYQVIDSYRALDRAKKEYPFSREEIEGQPLGVLGVQVEGGLKGIVVWSKREGAYDYWRSGNGVLLVTQAGRLIRTSGFPQDQLASRIVSGVEMLGQPLNQSQRYEVSRELDYLPDQYGIEAEYRLEYSKETQIQLLGRSLAVSEWKETVSFPKSRRQWKQQIQIDQATGQVVRSIQHVGPKMRVVLEQLKPAQVVGQSG